MAGLKIPYALTPAVALDQRYAHMREAIGRGLPRLQRRLIDDTRVLSIACYGPSLKDTWQELQHPIIGMSGSTKWLAERGVIVDYHIDMDPRANKAMTSLPAIPGVQYLVASCCAPVYFDALRDAGADVVLWHTVSSNWADDLKWVAEHDPGELVVSSGSTIGLGALQVGGVLGFRRFHIHGMDASFAQGARHAGPHAGKTQPVDTTWNAGGVRWQTSQIMANAAAEAVNTMRNFPVTAVFFGEGLTQALLREARLDNACCADEPRRAQVEGAAIEIVPMPPMAKGRLSFWEALLGFLRPTDLPELIANVGVCESRRPFAHYNTGTITLDQAVLLRAICRFYQPKVIAEVGTFIGMSTAALLPERLLYTCDRSNNLVGSTDRVLTHPFQSSTAMLTEIQEPVDLFFFDGRIQPEDLPHIQRLSHPGTVYVFDDYTGQEKGVANVALLMPLLDAPVLMGPDALFEGRSTLAALIPRRSAGGSR